MRKRKEKESLKYKFSIQVHFYSLKIVKGILTVVAQNGLIHSIASTLFKKKRPAPNTPSSSINTQTKRKLSQDKNCLLIKYIFSLTIVASI